MLFKAEFIFLFQTLKYSAHLSLIQKVKNIIKQNNKSIKNYKEDPYTFSLNRNLVTVRLHIWNILFFLDSRISQFNVENKIMS